jgi:hypothetical protein
MQCVTEYKSHGVPLEQYELTTQDRRAQRRHEALREWARNEVAKLPRWSDEHFAEIQQIVRIAHRRPAPPQMRWRVRLFCGHIVELSRAATSEIPTRDTSEHECSSCDGSTQVIVAYEPISPEAATRTLRGGRPTKLTQPTATTPRRSRTKAELEVENAALLAEVERLRGQLDAAPTPTVDPESPCGKDPEEGGQAH